MLKAYVEGNSEPADANAIYATLEVPADAQPPRLAIAVAQILLNKIQDTLPQWTAMKDDKLVVNREEHKRHKDARLAFNPKLICTRRKHHEEARQEDREDRDGLDAEPGGDR